MPRVLASGIDFYYADERVLTDVTFTVEGGSRLALIGENGSGKSTLLRLLHGELEPDAGHTEVTGDLGFLAQEVAHPPTATVQQIIDESLAPVRQLELDLGRAAQELEKLSVTHVQGESGERTEAFEQATREYDALLQRAEMADIWGAEARMEQVLNALDLAHLERNRPIRAMSGGQVRRLSLAQVLIRRPEIMLLDEPTNHVDEQGLEFLQQTLREFPGVVVLSSHDRTFLDAVATSIFDLDPFEASLRERSRGVANPSPDAAESERTDVRLYSGSYSDFLRQKRQERRAWEDKYASEQEELEWLRGEGSRKARDIKHREMRDNNKMSYGMRGARVDKQLSRRIRAADHRIAELEERAVERPPLALSFDASRMAERGRELDASDGGVLLRLKKAAVAGRVGPTDLVIQRGEKWLITGDNGSGKSTLLGLLAGDLKQTSGSVTRVDGLRVALLEQEVGLESDPRTPREIYALITGGLPGLPGVLDYGLLRPQDVDKPLKHLSAGVRRRLILQLQLVHTPDILLLDEPTNHLSLQLIEEIAAAITSTELTVVVASHDRWLRSTWSRKGKRLAL